MPALARKKLEKRTLCSHCCLKSSPLSEIHTWPHQPPRPPLSSREVTNEGQSVAVANEGQSVAVASSQNIKISLDYMVSYRRSCSETEETEYKRERILQRFHSIMIQHTTSKDICRLLFRLFFCTWDSCQPQNVLSCVCRLEFKDFRFQVAEDGKSISITKITRGGWYRINIDFKVADWVSRELKKAVNSMGERWFVSKYQSSTALMLLQKYCNDRGVFISLMELRRGTVCRVIVFPACKNGEGWVKAANALWEVVNGRVYFQTIREETWAIRERRYMPNDQTKSQIHSQSENQIGWGKVNLESKGTFAEVLRKHSIANVYEKHKTTRVKDGLDGIFKWDKMVVVSEKDGGHLIAIVAFEELDSKVSSGKGKELLCLEETEGADRDNIIAGPSQLVSNGIGTVVGEGNIKVEEKVKQGMVEGNKENEHVGINNFVQPLVLSNSGVGVGLGQKIWRMIGNRSEGEDGFGEDSLSGGDKLELSDFNFNNLLVEEAESDSEESFEDCCSVAERSSAHSEDENWLVSLFNGGEIETNSGLNGGGWREQFTKKEWKMRLLQGEGAGYPGNLGNKLVMSVLYYEELVNECNTGNEVTIRVGIGVEDGGNYVQGQKGEWEGIVVVVGEGNINGGGEFNNGLHIGASKGQPLEKGIRLRVSLKESKNSDEMMGKEEWVGLNRT
ncbi:hypothetical protein LguiA_007749 [Lonicera macranthoides]